MYIYILLNIAVFDFFIVIIAVFDFFYCYYSLYNSYGGLVCEIVFCLHIFETFVRTKRD